MAERTQGGWAYAAGDKSLQKKTSPDLVPWSSLSQDAKERDRNAVRAIPELLRRAGFRVTKSI
jgi:hypothetical protein